MEDISDSTIDGSIFNMKEMSNKLLEDIGSRKHQISFSRTHQIEEILPNCSRMSRYLSTFGYTTLEMLISDMDPIASSISVFVIDAWAESILNAITQLGDQLRNQQNAVKEASSSLITSENGRDILYNRITELQNKLSESEKEKKKREKSLRTKIQSLEDVNQHRVNQTKIEENDFKKQIRNLEQQIQESERRNRQKETELDRIKDKMKQFVEKEKQTSVKHKNILDQLNVRSNVSTSLLDSDISYHSITSGEGTSTSPTHKKSFLGSSPHHLTYSTPQKHHRTSTTPSKTNGNTNLIPLIEALEAERSELLQKNVDLENQLQNMSTLLTKFENHRPDSDASKPSHPKQKATAPSSNSGHAEDEPSGWTPTAKRMHEKISEQAKLIDKLQQRLATAHAIEHELQENLSELRSKCTEYRNEIENLRLELESRPSARQWTMMRRELHDVEEKLHDMVMVRGEANELLKWKQHLSTRDRIKIDKRNHELGLWVLDSLPKAVLKEVLQGVCRELDLTDLTEIVPSIVKLKAVVKTVPRMESFITNIYGLVIDRDDRLKEIEQQLNHLTDQNGGETKRNPDHRKDIEDAFPILKRWWIKIQKCFQLEQFRDAVWKELFRRELILTKYNLKEHVSKLPPSSANQVDGIIDELYKTKGKLQFTLRDTKKTSDLIRDLVDVEVGIMNQPANILSAQDYIRNHPEVIVSRIIHHIQYLFQIQSLDGILPKINQIYIQTQDIDNFLSSIRKQLIHSNSVGLMNLDPVWKSLDDNQIHYKYVFQEIQRIVDRYTSS